MHESRVVADLITRVEAEVDPREQRVGRVSLRIGALSGISPTALALGVEEHATRVWGYAPEVVADQSEDLGDLAATGVTLTSILVGD
jgi:Zn finger protein HypA/HybF involved in hydrogenase expression